MYFWNLLSYLILYFSFFLFILYFPLFQIFWYLKSVLGFIHSSLIVTTVRSELRWRLRGCCPSATGGVQVRLCSPGVQHSTRCILMTLWDDSLNCRILWDSNADLSPRVPVILGIKDENTEFFRSQTYLVYFTG